MSVVAGFDLGGSHSACLLADDTGRILGRGTGGPANLVNMGHGRVLASVREALSLALQAVPGGMNCITRCVIGAAGGGTPANAVALVGLACEAGLACPVTVTHDAAIALAGGLLLQPGIIVMAGTGSITYGVDDAGNRVRAGGFGPLLSDEGSGYWIGLRGLRAALRAIDGREEATCLTVRLAESLGVPGVEGLSRLPYEPAKLNPASVAALAPAVFAAAGAGDRIAAGIVDAAAAELALLVLAVANRLEDGPHLPVTYGGGLFGAGAMLLKPLREHLERHNLGLAFQPPAGPPLLGAALLALAEEGVQVDKVAAQLQRGLE